LARKLDDLVRALGADTDISKSEGTRIRAMLAYSWNPAKAAWNIARWCFSRSIA